MKDLMEDIDALLYEMLDHPRARGEDGDLSPEIYRLLRRHFSEVELEVASLPEAHDAG